eukprot:ANDGO_01553.mRNA.1 hypothetical protein
MSDQWRDRVSGHMVVYDDDDDDDDDDDVDHDDREDHNESDAESEKSLLPSLASRASTRARVKRAREAELVADWDRMDDVRKYRQGGSLITSTHRFEHMENAVYLRYLRRNLNNDGILSLIDFIQFPVRNIFVCSDYDFRRKTRFDFTHAGIEFETRVEAEEFAEWLGDGCNRSAFEETSASLAPRKLRIEVGIPQWARSYFKRPQKRGKIEKKTAKYLEAKARSIAAGGTSGRG